MGFWKGIYVCLLLLAVTKTFAEDNEPQKFGRDQGGPPRRLLQRAAVVTCPFDFPQQDLADAAGACTTIFAQGSSPVGSCCTKLLGVVSLAQARYANSTGNLLVSDAEATVCFQTMIAGLRGVTVSNADVLLTSCNITTSRISVPACGSNLVTVEAFSAAANRSFPATAVINGCFRGTNCSECTAAKGSSILSLAASNLTDPDMLTTTQCQDLATVALVASAVPGAVASGISKCSWGAEIVPVVQENVCTAAPWGILDFSAVQKSCGPEAYHFERCCHIMIGMFAQMMTYRVQNGEGPIPEEQLDPCQEDFEANLELHGVDSTLLDTCQLGGPYFLSPQACYNYTFYNGVPFPSQYLRPLDSVCGAKTCNTNCTTNIIALGTELGLVNTNFACVVYIVVKYMAAQNNLLEATDRLNCFMVLPQPLNLGLNQTTFSGMNITELGLQATTGGKRLGTKAIVAIVIATFVVVLVLMFVAVWVGLRLRKELPGWSFYKQKSLSKSRSMPAGPSESFSSGQIIFYTYSELKRATCNFAQGRLLGRGGSGSVYLGHLTRSGGEVAVKEIVKPRSKGIKEFGNEVDSMSRCRHRHLVALLGVCVSKRRCVLVYEYMVNGSLEDHLYAPLLGAERVQARGEPIFLTWPMRSKIAVGTAKGLAYLHEGCSTRIIHRDVKPSNILLDKQFEAKVCDFGLAKFTEDEDTHVSTGIAGTWGYLAPEYVATNQLTEKSDVYSYGVVLLTLIAGRRPTDASLQEDEVFLPEYAWIVAEQGKLRSLVDPRLVADHNFEDHWVTMERVLRIALLCIHTVVTTRPTMRQCIAMLQGEVEVPPLPPRPMTLFTVGLMATGHSSSSIRCGSLNFAKMDVVHESSLSGEWGSLEELDLDGPSWR